MSLFPHITQVFLDKVFSLLVPLFLTAAGGNPEAARLAVESLLASYDVETEEEMRLAAEITSFGFGALEALCNSMAPDLSLSAVLRLRGSANAMHRSGHQCQRALDKLRKERQTVVAETQAEAPTLPSHPARDDRSSHPAPIQPRAAIPLSRQQRRAKEREAEKAQRKQAEQTRRDAMRATRSVCAPVLGMTAPPQQAPDQSRAA